MANGIRRTELRRDLPVAEHLRYLDNDCDVLESNLNRVEAKVDRTVDTVYGGVRWIVYLVVALLVTASTGAVLSVVFQ